MDMKGRLILALILGIAAVLAQVPSPQAAPFVARFGPARPLAEKPIVKEPYCGERKRDKAPSNARPDLEWRDSAGRTRIERYFLMSRPVPGTTLQWHSLTTIVDPVAGVQYVLDIANKIAHRQVLPPAVKAPPSGSNPSPWLIGTYGCCGVVNSPVWPADDSRDFPSTSPLESPFPAGPAGGRRRGKKLGTRIIEGIKAEGIRYDDKGKMAGGVPASRTEEVWTSPELHVRLLYSYAFLTGGPRITSTERLTHISRSEPDPALFQVPPDYQVVNEAAGFAISIPR
jgi:hypothetical protein